MLNTGLKLRRSKRVFLLREHISKLWCWLVVVVVVCFFLTIIVFISNSVIQNYKMDNCFMKILNIEIYEKLEFCLKNLYSYIDKYYLDVLHHDLNL